jgi:hypothetical protein
MILFQEHFRAEYVVILILFNRLFINHIKDGPAYLVEDTINISIGNPEERMLLTGLHIIADISCDICKTKVS